jgi:glycosyltransferase involved in cell wall biosynthesis
MSASARAKEWVLLVSVIIPTYNRKAYVCQAIDSALDQTYPDVEVMVVDDGSTDGTGEVVQARYGDRIRYIYQSNQGEAAARNSAIRHSRGDLIALLDSDDLWKPDKLAKQVALLERRPEVGLVSCHAQAIDADGNLIGTGVMKPDAVLDSISLERLIFNSPLIIATVIVRRECLEQVGLFWEDIDYGEDRGFCLRVAAIYQVGFVPETLVLIRRHRDNQTHALMTREQIEHRLADRTCVNDRLFDFFEMRGKDVARLKPRAQAVECARAAFPIYAAGDNERGAALLARAVQLDPATWGDGEEAAEAVFRQALAIAQGRSSDAALCFVRGFYAHLPTHLRGWARQFRPHVLARLHIVFAFQDYEEGQSKSVRANLLKGVAHDASWLRNGGVLSMAVEVFAGPRLAAIGRSLCRPFVSRTT